MTDLTGQSDRILADARRLRDDNRDGGRHRRALSPAAGGGDGAKRLKRRHLQTKLRNAVVALLALWLAGGVIGTIVGGIGVLGVVALLLASVAAILVLAQYPRLKVPNRADLNTGNVRQMVARTELWLEAQRPALPPPAAALVADMGVQLDTLGVQLEALDPAHPKAQEIRSLVGEQLPEMIDSYRRIPAALRTETRAGSTPDTQITEGLARISGEIDAITRHLAEGSLDDLAIRHRYLDYKFGEGAETSPQLEHKP